MKFQSLLIFITFNRCGGNNVSDDKEEIEFVDCSRYDKQNEIIDKFFSRNSKTEDNHKYHAFVRKKIFQMLNDRKRYTDNVLTINLKNGTCIVMWRNDDHREIRKFHSKKSLFESSSEEEEKETAECNSKEQNINNETIKGESNGVSKLASENTESSKKDKEDAEKESISNLTSSDQITSTHYADKIREDIKRFRTKKQDSSKNCEVINVDYYINDTGFLIREFISSVLGKSAFDHLIAVPVTNAFFYLSYVCSDSFGHPGYNKYGFAYYFNLVYKCLCITIKYYEHFEPFIPVDVKEPKKYILKLMDNMLWNRFDEKDINFCVFCYFTNTILVYYWKNGYTDTKKFVDTVKLFEAKDDAIFKFFEMDSEEVKIPDSVLQHVTQGIIISMKKYSPFLFRGYCRIKEECYYPYEPKE